MKVCFGKDQQRSTQVITPTHDTVTDPMRRMEGQSCKLYMENFFFSLDLFET